MEFECILYEKKDGIATIKLNRPRVLNAMNKQLWIDFQAALDQVQSDPDIKVLIITGGPGTGKTTIVQEIVQKHARTQPVPVDWCMVNNFREPFRPKAIPVRTGGANRFAKNINRLIKDLMILEKSLQYEPDLIVWTVTL